MITKNSVVKIQNFIMNHDPLSRTLSGIILKTEGNVQKIQKRALFHYKKVKKGTPNLTSPMFIASLQLI